MFMLDEALQYAGRGWRVFPLHHIVEGQCSCGRSCASPASTRASKAGSRRRPPTTAQITAWWSKWPRREYRDRDRRRPDVVDLDGPEGAAQLQAMVAEHGRLPPDPDGPDRARVPSLFPRRGLELERARQGPHPRRGRLRRRATLEPRITAIITSGYWKFL